MRLELIVNYSQPGTIVDTVGIAAAKPGSFAILIAPSGHVHARVYDPGKHSRAKGHNGWHGLQSSTIVPKNTRTLVVFEMWKGQMALWVGGKLADKLELDTPLSGDVLYAGDYPGDAAFAPRYNTHTAMVGTIELTYLGALDPKSYVQAKGQEIKR